MANKQKHILVISDPPAKPGYLPRLRYMCDYLVRQGYAVTLLTEEYQPLSFEHTYPIETIKMYRGGTFDWFVKTVWTLLTDWHNRVFAQKAITCLNNKPITYSMVLCSAFSDFPLGAARRIAHAWQVPLVCDIRDLDEQVNNSRYQYHHQNPWLMPFRNCYRAVHIRRRNSVLRAANAIITISPWHAEFIRMFNRNTYIVYNGFDEQQFYPADIPTDTFRITYIGSLFEWQKPALAKVQQAIEALPISVVLDIHTPQCAPIAHNRLGDAIRRSSIMLVLTSPDTHGMLTTKFYEALGCEKPLLCVPSDEGSLAEIIRYTNAGLATDDIEQIKMFILAKYREWETNGFTRQQTQHRTEFSRETQCEQLHTIIHRWL